MLQPQAFRKNKKSTEDLTTFSKEELISKVQQLEAHIKQLKNILSKKESGKEVKSSKQQRPFQFNQYSKRHIALKIIYFGWNYQGFVSQEDTLQTIESQLFDALIKTRLIESRETSNYHRCGRTDKGVSAFSQVISLDVRSNLLSGPGVVSSPDSSEIQKRKKTSESEIEYIHILNKLLPPEIRVTAWAPVEPTFSARFDCRRRTYKYFFPKGNLDIEKMKVAAQQLIGEHDFRNFCKMDVGNGVTNFIRRIHRVSINEVANSSNSECGYQLFELSITGQAFLWHQVRCIVAVLFLIGENKESDDVLKELLDINKYPCKPQYSMASELPLVLYDCEFDQIDWQCSSEEKEELILHIQQLWTSEAIKACIIKKALNDLEMSGNNELAEKKESLQNQCQQLIQGPKQKVYKPLLERPLCESLEQRIQHYKKRRKILEDSEADEKA